MTDRSEQTILIVDDNPKNLQLLGSILRDNEYRVEFATNGSEAIEWIEEQDFDLVLLDIMMPEMDGYEACKKIREQPQLNDMPIIFLTAKINKESIVKGFDSGAQDYISKPFDTKELLARVDTHIELRKSKLQLKEVNSWLEAKVKERTAQLEQANRQLSTLDEAKTEFLNLIGHEIRTPLNGIVGPMQLIRSDARDPELELMLKLMEDSVERLEKFAFLALSITDLRTGKYIFKAEEINLAKLFARVDSNLSLILREKRTRLIINIKDTISANGDTGLLESCFEKLIENSLQYISEEGELHINAESKTGFININISDKRLKFSEDFLDNMNKLFEPRGKYADSNLGIEMVLVNLILKAHNASIDMENLDIKGATLTIRIPQ